MNKKIDRKIIAAGIALILLIIITITLLSGKIISLDNKVHNIIINLRKEKLTDTMIIITNICSTYSLIGISLLALICLKNKKIPILIIMNLISATLLSQIFKFIIRRERPIGINLIEESGYSYPSGHSMVSMAFFGLIAYLIYKNIKNKFYKTLSIISLLVVIFLIGFSRIYLGVHYFSDVLAGFLTAIAYLMIFITLTNKYKVTK
ncbi:MAG: phosphatase PAP2 family protein [Bacilli bacterium]|nr:phosphatase PAP2 family protein [Bacilli bacterium]